YAKWMDGRIDDPNGGWKGRGLWSTFGNRTPFHVEGGKGTTPKVVRFQLRRDPLARENGGHKKPELCNKRWLTSDPARRRRRRADQPRAEARSRARAGNGPTKNELISARNNMLGGMHASDPAVFVAFPPSREHLPVDRAHIHARFLRHRVRNRQRGDEAKLSRPLCHLGLVGDPDLRERRSFDGGVVSGSEDFAGSDDYPLRLGDHVARPACAHRSDRLDRALALPAR